MMVDNDSLSIESTQTLGGCQLPCGTKVLADIDPVLKAANSWLSATLKLENL